MWNERKVIFVDFWKHSKRHMPIITDDTPVESSASSSFIYLRSWGGRRVLDQVIQTSSFQVLGHILGERVLRVFDDRTSSPTKHSQGRLVLSFCAAFVDRRSTLHSHFEVLPTPAGMSLIIFLLWYQGVWGSWTGCFILTSKHSACQPHTTALTPQASYLCLIRYIWFCRENSQV